MQILRYLKKILNSVLTLPLLFILLSFQSTYSQNNPDAKKWVDSVYNTLTIEQRLGQLLMLRANSTGDQTETKQLTSLITTYNIGGLCFFKGGPVAQAKLTNYYQSIAPTPLLISMDAEWGLGMRLDSTISFPRQMTMAAIRDESQITEYGLAIASQLKRLGVHMSFSPVADINNNPRNPVINIRSFGENKEDVARKAILYMKALQKGGIIAIAKHFPGHGDTDTDSHFALPIINHSFRMIDSLELFPFKQLINAGIDGMMIGHMFIPALDSTKNLPSSLSPKIINDLLKTRLQFNGLIITDALEMKGVSNYASKGLVELKALQAGNDILLLPESIDAAVIAIENAINDGTYDYYDLEMHCKKILSAKYHAGLWEKKTVEINNLYSDLHQGEQEQLNLKFYEQAITVLLNRDSILPLRNSDTLRLASVTFGYFQQGVLQSRMSQYARMDHFTISKSADVAELNLLKQKLSSYNMLIINVVNTIPSPKRNFGIPSQVLSFIDSLLFTKSCIVNLFTLPYGISLFKNIEKANALLVAYQDNEDVYDAVSQIIFGSVEASGKLPVSVNRLFPYGSGINTSAIGRFRINSFENSGFLPSDFTMIDSIVNEGMKQKAYPGAQLLIAKSGNVVYNKTFGNSDYIQQKKVRDTDLYDMASLTKIAATTLAMMKLYDAGLYDLDTPIAKTLHYLEKTNKSKITFREILTHQSGLIAWIPFYKQTLINNKPDTTYYKKVYSSKFPIKVADSMYLRYDFPDKILDSIAHSPLLKKEYRYSDLGFILLKQYIEKVSGMTLDSYVEKEFYKPLGLTTLCFKPLKSFAADRIMPTENDTAFRKQILRGYVHDQAAAMLGGVSGHAGLFGNAWDMAVLMQMLLQNGSYGGKEYLKPSTVQLFTKSQFKGNRRALGFDKPQLIPSEPGPASPYASKESYGHTGFTGTYFWADPENDLLIVFFTNRVNPDTEPNKLVKLGIRTEIQEACYDALRRNGSTKTMVKRKTINTTD